MFTDPPVVSLLVVANANQFGPSPHGEFILRRSPATTNRSTVNAQKHERGFPSALGIEIPYIRIAVGGTREEAVVFGGPVDAGNSLGMFRECFLELPGGPLFGVDHDLFGIGGNGDFCLNRGLLLMSPLKQKTGIESASGKEMMLFELISGLRCDRLFSVAVYPLISQDNYRPD